MSEQRIEPRDPGSARAWFGVLTGPAAWAVQLIGSWVFGEVIACSPGNRTFGSILGLHVNAFAAVVNGTLLALTVLSGLAAYAELRARRDGTDETPGQRATELARAGVITSILFVVLIAASFVPIVLVGGCR
jgi:hypothetical protein